MAHFGHDSKDVIPPQTADHLDVTEKACDRLSQNRCLQYANTFGSRPVWLHYCWKVHMPDSVRAAHAIRSGWSSAQPQPVTIVPRASPNKCPSDDIHPHRPDLTKGGSDPWDWSLSITMNHHDHACDLTPTHHQCSAANSPVTMLPSQAQGHTRQVCGAAQCPPVL